jgi:hypothetical protein
MKREKERKTNNIEFVFFGEWVFFSLFLSVTKNQKDNFKKNNKKEIVARSSFLQKTFVKM